MMNTCLLWAVVMPPASIFPFSSSLLRISKVAVNWSKSSSRSSGVPSKAYLPSLLDVNFERILVLGYLIYGFLNDKWFWYIVQKIHILRLLDKMTKPSNPPISLYCIWYIVKVLQSWRLTKAEIDGFCYV